MLNFSEAFVGGFFGICRTYGAVARFECQKAQDLEADWPAALREAAAWRSRRGVRATALHLYVIIPASEVWAAVALLAPRLLVPPAARAPELRGLRLEVAVFDSLDMGLYFDLTLFPEESSADTLA